MREFYQNRYQKIIIELYDGDTIYTLALNEKIVFGVKQKNALAVKNTYTISKVLTSSDFDENENAYVLELTSEDTDIAAGYYYYDIALLRSTGELETLVGCQECHFKASCVRDGDW